jgi:Mlc titration factor MtfA (ptsG expression regulator)
MLSWFRRGARPAAVDIDERLWSEATAPWLFMRGLSQADVERLRALSGAFIASKHFSGTHDLEVTDRMQVEIAAQACILVLELGIDWYQGWSEIIVYPSQFAPEREFIDEAGITHLTQDPMAGEAWLGGPVILSYEDVALTADEATRVAGYNVVIHEFAHKLDMRNGEPNGLPPLHEGMSVATWGRAFRQAYEDFCARVDAAESLPDHRIDDALDELPLDPYACESAAEFFAVGSEAFFETPELLHEAYPAVYGQLMLFYKQDPLTRAGATV